MQVHYIVREKLHYSVHISLFFSSCLVFGKFQGHQVWRWKGNGKKRF